MSGSFLGEKDDVGAARGCEVVVIFPPSLPARYFETSYFSHDADAGGTLDGSVVFSQDSYLPRSANLNLTVSVFGENLNLLEVGARAEGFENTLEEIFGPEGYFRLVQLG